MSNGGQKPALLWPSSDSLPGTGCGFAGEKEAGGARASSQGSTRTAALLCTTRTAGPGPSLPSALSCEPPGPEERQPGSHCRNTRQDQNSCVCSRTVASGARREYPSRSTLRCACGLVKPLAGSATSTSGPGLRGRSWAGRPTGPGGGQPSSREPRCDTREPGIWLSGGVLYYPG